MSDALPSLSELIERALNSRLGDVNVSMPGEIVSYDAATQTATVRPALRPTVFADDDSPVAEEIPPLQNVPVSFPGGAGFTIHFPLAAGDTGDLIFSTWNHNEWQAGGTVSTPGDLRMHGLGGAKFYPGIRSKKNAAPDTDVSIGLPGGLRIHFASGAISIGAGGQFVALSDATEARLQALETFAATHTHATAGTGAPSPGLPTFVPTATPVASSNLKADP